MVRSYGNTDSVDCPNCGGEIRDLWDYGNALYDEGLEIQCPQCEAMVKVADVYSEHVVVLSS